MTFLELPHLDKEVTLTIFRFFDNTPPFEVVSDMCINGSCSTSKRCFTTLKLTPLQIFLLSDFHASLISFTANKSASMNLSTIFILAKFGPVVVKKIVNLFAICIWSLINFCELKAFSEGVFQNYRFSL